VKTYPGPLVRAGLEAPDRIYNNLRDRTELKADREFIEHLWSSYWPYADSEFYRDIGRDFVARFWEMDLACGLLALGFTLEEQRRRGPDVCVALGGRRIWLEAVAPRDGEGPNASPDLIHDGLARTFDGEDRVILRFRQAIKEKFEKYGGYREAGIVEPIDHYVIALNASRVSASIIETDNPAIVKSVYPLGTSDWQFSFETGTVKVLPPRYRPSVQTAEKSEVATNVFLDAAYAGISGILFSRADAFNRRDDWVFVHNLSAANRLERGWLPAGTEYWPEIDGISVIRHSGHPEE